MKQKIVNFLKNEYRKLILIALLAPACLFFNQMEFPRIETTIRDSLQFLNSSADVDKSLVTVNIDTSTGEFKRPFTLNTFQSVISKIQEGNPKHIILLISPSEIDSRETERRKILTYFLENKNLLLYGQVGKIFGEAFNDDPIFKNFPSFFTFTMTGDSQDASDSNLKHRRVVLSFDNVGPDRTPLAIQKLGYTTKDISQYKYPYRYWETTQVFMKTFPQKAFGDIQTQDIFSEKFDKSSLYSKTVLIGAFDEFSFVARPSVFDLFGKKTENNFKTFNYPFQSSVANLINLHLTGNYIKLLSPVNDIALTFLVLTFLILSNFSIRNKIYSFLTIIPIFLIFEFFIYWVGDFYIDFSRSIALIFFTQYLAIPILMLAVFKSQETAKQKAIDDTRIDSLLMVSEKVAHDIRSPLSAINLMISKAKFDNPEYLEIINSALKRIDETAEKILIKYRMGPSSKHDVFEPIDLVELTKNLISEKKVLAEKITYTMDATQSRSFQIIGYKIELERVLSNIIDNSIYALAEIENPKIFFKIESIGEFVLIEIADNGSGISSAIVSLLGKQRITTKPDNRGSGIGILHSKRTIERMGGTFDITSTTKKGTTVSIKLKNLSQIGPER